MVAVFVTILMVAFPIKYKPLIRTAANEHGVDKTIIASVINAESKFKKDAVSKKGAVGLMQIMPSTGEFIAEMMGIDDYNLLDEQTNIEMGTFYLRYLLDKFVDLKTALMAYNAGEGNVTNWIANGLGSDNKLEKSPYPATNKYVEKVLNGMNMYKFRV